jgi:hypothetical protein
VTNDWTVAEAVEGEFGSGKSKSSHAKTVINNGTMYLINFISNLLKG